MSPPVLMPGKVPLAQLSASPVLPRQVSLSDAAESQTFKPECWEWGPFKAVSTTQAPPGWGMLVGILDQKILAEEIGHQDL